MIHIFLSNKILFILKDIIFYLAFDLQSFLLTVTNAISKYGSVHLRLQFPVMKICEEIQPINHVL